MTSGLQLALNTLATDIAAIPTSQVILSNGTFVNQHRFGIENGDVVLDLNLGWLFRATPLWSQVLRDPMRVRQAKMGHLPLDPAADCLVYLPFAGSTLDMGPSTLHLVTPTSDTQGTWGVYDYMPPKVDSCGWLAQADGFIFPNRDVPTTQVTSKGIGWGNTTSDSWLVECQMWLPPDCIFYITMTADADVDASAPDNINHMYASTQNGKMGFTWDDRTGVSGHFNQPTISNAITANRWFHVAMQKNSGASIVRVYLDGVLRMTENVGYPMSNIDVVQIDPRGTGVPFIREFSIRTLAAYPTVPFTPGSVGFASSMGDPQMRWNSYMLG